jgi:hypothetical protein
VAAAGGRGVLEDIAVTVFCAEGRSRVTGGTSAYTTAAAAAAAAASGEEVGERSKLAVCPGREMVGLEMAGAGAEESVNDLALVELVVG